MGNVDQAKWLVDNVNQNIPVGLTTPITVRFAKTAADKAAVAPFGVAPFGQALGSSAPVRYNPYGGQSIPDSWKNLFAAAPPPAAAPVPMAMPPPSAVPAPAPGQFQNNGIVKAWYEERGMGFIAPATGRYRFKLTSDDGSQLWLGTSKKVMKRYVYNGGLHSMRASTGMGKFGRGQVAMRVEYYENSGPAGCLLHWKRIIPGRRTGWIYMSRRNVRYQVEYGFKEEAFYIGAVKRIPNLNRKRASHQRRVSKAYYGLTKNTWKGWRRADNFAARWTGYLKIRLGGRYRFYCSSDDGSRVWSRGRLILNNDGLHSWRRGQATRNFRSGSWNPIVVEYFERGGHAGVWFVYNGRDTSNYFFYVGSRRKLFVPFRSMRTPRFPARRRRQRRKRLGRRMRSAFRRSIKRRRGGFR